MSTEPKAQEPSDFACQLASLISTFASKAMTKEETQELLSELLDQALSGGLALGYHPRDLLATMRERAIEFAKQVKMVCVDCKGKGTVPAVLGPEGAIYECRTCGGTGSLTPRVDADELRCAGPNVKVGDCPLHSLDLVDTRTRVEQRYKTDGIVTKPETPEAKATDPLATLAPEELAHLARSRRE